jgi:hypothetical protein
MQLLPTSGELYFSHINQVLGVASNTTRPLSTVRTEIDGIPSSGNILVSDIRGKGRKVQQTLYAFTTHTFTNANAQSNLGPDLATIRSVYNSTISSNIDMSVRGIQRWTVPESKTYRFTVAGAKGGNGSSRIGASGRIVSGDLPLNAGDTLHIVVGQNGVNHLYNPGGGGGSFVFLNSVNTVNLLFAAGGGGGSTHTATGSQGSTTGSGLAGTTGVTSGATTGGIGGSAGTNGGGGGGGGGVPAGVAGTAGTNTGTGGSGGGTSSVQTSGGGGGCGVGNATITSTFVGGVGGVAASANGSGSPGGFGGGGGGGRGMDGGGGAGGGGGYSGGGGGGASYTNAGGGGGGGSFVAANVITPNLNVGVNANNGYVTITKL